MYPVHVRKNHPCQIWLNYVYFTKRRVSHQREALLCCFICLPAPRCWTQCWSRMTEGWRHKDTVGVSTLASFIETALVWAACNSSEALVLTVAWQSFHSLDRGREKMVWGRKQERKRSPVSLKVTFQIKQAKHGIQGVLAQSTQSHWGPARTPHHSLHCTHQGSQALGYKWAITMVWVTIFLPRFI